MALRDQDAPRVTVIMATYNWSTVLPFSIGSVLDQTFDDFELLVIGDGCTDDSADVVSRIGDERVRWINLETNTGFQSGPNNEGLKQARGEFIAYIGHDDLWLPHHLETRVQAMMDGADLAFGILEYVNPAEASLPGPNRLEEYQRGNSIPPTLVMHRKSVTEKSGGWKFPEETGIAPDCELWQRAFDTGFSFQFIPRLSAIKFSASARRDVYRVRPSHEQEEWLKRIRSETDFERCELARMLINQNAALRTAQIESMMGYRKLAKAFMKATSEYARRCFSAGRKKDRWTENREFRGLPPKP